MLFRDVEATDAEPRPDPGDRRGQGQPDPPHHRRRRDLDEDVRQPQQAGLLRLHGDVAGRARGTRDERPVDGKFRVIRTTTAGEAGRSCHAGMPKAVGRVRLRRVGHLPGHRRAPRRLDRIGRGREPDLPDHEPGSHLDVADSTIPPPPPAARSACPSATLRRASRSAATSPARRRHRRLGVHPGRRAHLDRRGRPRRLPVGGRLGVRARRRSRWAPAGATSPTTAAAAGPRSGKGFDSVQCVPGGVCWSSGSHGRVGRLVRCSGRANLMYRGGRKLRLRYDTNLVRRVQTPAGAADGPRTTVRWRLRPGFGDRGDTRNRTPRSTS